MKLGIISDIHADFDALGLSLRILESQGVDQIICAGDLVERGRQGNAVVELIQARGIPCVLGNHDEVAASNQQWLRDNIDPTNTFAQERLLSQPTLDYLNQLPKTLTFEWEGKTVLLAHGAPWSNMEYVFPVSNLTPLFKRIVEQAASDIVVLGNTHIPMEVTYGNTKLVNPGSVCGKQERDGSSTCGILTLPESRFEIYHLPTQQPTTFRQLHIPG
jgi:putative phosphoesterase